jgi:NAD(P)-dependent dehydrogenase (short-subunit alcohol dehydrogenase family)
MEIDLNGAAVALDGETNPIVDAVLAALRVNGGTLVEAGDAADILLMSNPLRPGTTMQDPRCQHADARRAAVAMAERGGGRIVFLISATAGMPMRRHPRFSMENASILAGMRTLAMEFGPKVLVNAVGFGMVEAETLLSGDAAQLSHTPLNRAGTVEEAVAAVLFLCDPMNSYTTGQILSVDGGWSAGYGRNF